MKQAPRQGSRRCSPGPHAQRRSIWPQRATPKAASGIFSGEHPHQKCGARHRPSSPPPVATAYPKQEAHVSVSTSTGSDAAGGLNAVTTAPPTLLTTEDLEAKDGMRRPPLRRPNSPVTEVSTAVCSTVQRQTPTIHQSTGNKSPTSAVQPHGVRHLAPLPPYRRRRVVSASPSSSCLSFSASDTHYTTSGSCSSTSCRVACRTQRSRRRNFHRNRRHPGAPASATYPSASSAASRGSKTSRCASKRQWNEHRVIFRRAYPNASSSRSPSSATSRDDTTAGSRKTSSNCFPGRWKDMGGIKDNNASLLPLSPAPVTSTCVLTDVLPRDVYLHICGFLTEVDCCTLLEVSLHMHAAITSADSNVWRHICLSTWMWKQGFQTFIQQTRALESLTRQEEREVLALQQHMLLLREKNTVFGESDVSATCDCATVLIRRRQHERAQWMAAANAAAGTGISALYHASLTNRVGSATTSASSTTRTDSCSDANRESRSRRRKKLGSRLRHGGTRHSIATTASTSRRSGNLSSAAERRSTHATRPAETAGQRRLSSWLEVTDTSRASWSLRKRSDRLRGDEDTCKSVIDSSSSSSQTSSSSGVFRDEATRNGKRHKQAYLSNRNWTDHPESRQLLGGSYAGERGLSATHSSTQSPPPLSSHARALTDQHERENVEFLVALGSANVSVSKEVSATERLSMRGSETGDRRQRRVCIRLPEEKAAEGDQDNNANLTDTSACAVRSRSGSRHRRRHRRSSSHRPLSPAHGQRRHRRRDGSPQQQHRQRSKPPGSRYRRSHSVKRRKPARQRRRRRGRSRGPRSTGGGGGRHRSQSHRGQSRHHRSAHQHHHSTKVTQSSRRRRRRQRNAAAAAAAAQANRDGNITNAYASSLRGAAHTNGAGGNTYFYQTATYEAIKSTTPVHQAQHLAPSVVPFKLGARLAPAARAAEAAVSQNQSKVQHNPCQPGGSEEHSHEPLATSAAVAQTVALLSSGSGIAERTAPIVQQGGSVSQQVAPSQATAGASCLVALPGTSPSEEGLYWWQLTPEARQRQLRRMQQRERQQYQQRASPSDGRITRAVPSLPDGDELADEAALREWDELEAPSFGSLSDTTDEESTDTSQDEDREEEYSDPNATSAASDGNTDREGRTENGHHRCPCCPGGRKSWWSRSRSARRSTLSDTTMWTEARRRHSHRQHHGSETGTSSPSSSSSSSRTHTHPPPSLDDDDDGGADCELGVDSTKERWTRADAHAAASLPYQRCRLSDVTGKHRRKSYDDSHPGRSDDANDRYDAEEGAVVVPSTARAVISEADKKCITSDSSSSSSSSSSGDAPSRVRRTGRPYTSPGTSLSASVSSLCRPAIRAERRLVKALAKRYEPIEEAMMITHSKSVLIHTLERQTHAHLPRLLAAAAQRQRRLVMMSTRPAAAAAAQHTGTSLISSTVALHSGTPEFSEAASVSATRAIFLIGPGSGGFNGNGGVATALPVAASPTATPAPHHLPSSLENPFSTVAAATLGMPASPLQQLARITSFNATANPSAELRGRVNGMVSSQEHPCSSRLTTNTASPVADTVDNTNGFGPRALAHPRNLLERHHTDVALGNSGVSGAALPSTDSAPMQLTNEDEVEEEDEDDDDDDEEEQLAPVSWKFAFFMSRREAQRAKITLQDLLEGMWVVCFRSSGRTHPIRFMRQNQIIVYPPLPTEEEERPRRHHLEPSGAQVEAALSTPAATETNAVSASPPLPFHILQGGMQLVVHQFPPMRVTRRNASQSVTAVVGGAPTTAVPTPPTSAPGAATLTPSMMAEKRFAAEPQATLRKMRLCMLASDARDEATLEAMAVCGITGGSNVANCAVEGGKNRAAGRDFGGRDCTSFDFCNSSSAASSATTNDVRRAIAQRLGFPAAYIHEVLGQAPAKPNGEHLSGDADATMCRKCSATASQARRQPVFYGPQTRREFEEEQRREALFAPGGTGDVLNDWGWTIASQHVKIFSLDVTAPLYVERLQRVAYVEISGRSRGRERDPGAS
ncbi:hypothetical protein JKF63_01086 [Porcisia hertigi]|uniref:F-box domain-containing protein n=1 Tax=Porcisia hertigi TaxID=2761500 RepID=A0A836IDR5_9TRYP|nr:hypothetical protein JKF63_01086 [Porcisia hertigi]